MLATERVVVGQRLSARVACKAGAIAVKGPEPLANNAYKVELLGGTVEEALLAIA
jgi:CO/xanthine dehydrogenase FAD-binding subunit